MEKKIKDNLQKKCEEIIEIILKEKMDVFNYDSDDFNIHIRRK